MKQTLPKHVQAILEGDFGVEECFDIMRAARIRAEHEFRNETELTSTSMIDAVHEMFAPLNDLSDEVEMQLRRLQVKLSGAA